MEEFNSDDYLQQRQKQSKIPANFFQVKLLILLVVLGIFVYVAWYAYNRTDEVDEGTLPLITASDEIIKSKPENPGGLVVANRDKDIYDGISATAIKKVKKEKPIAPPVVPASKQIVVQTIKQELQTTEKPEKEEIKSDFIVSTKVQPVELKVAEDETTELDKELDDLSSKTEQVPASSIETVERPVPAVVTETSAIKPAELKSDQIVEPAAEQRSYTVRIAALRNEDAAIAAWKSLRATYSNIIGGLGSEVQVVDKDGKNIYYLHAGPIATKEQAEQICKSLQEQGRRCRVY